MIKHDAVLRIADDLVISLPIYRENDARVVCETLIPDDDRFVRMFWPRQGKPNKIVIRGRSQLPYAGEDPAEMFGVDYVSYFKRPSALAPGAIVAITISRGDMKTPWYGVITENNEHEIRLARAVTVEEAVRYSKEIQAEDQAETASA